MNLSLDAPLYTHPQPKREQEPVPEHKLKDVRCECCGYMTNHREHMGCIRAAQPKREPLTDEQIVAMWEFPRDLSWMDSVVRLAHAIERTHGIK